MERSSKKFCCVESVDVDEVFARVPEFLSNRLDDHSLPSPVVSQEADVPLLIQTVNQLLLFLSPEKNAADNILAQRKNKTSLDSVMTSSVSDSIDLGV